MEFVALEVKACKVGIADFDAGFVVGPAKRLQPA
jgi:hypothetical protein